MSAIDWAEQGRVPDRLIRIAIRRLLKMRLAQEHADDPDEYSRLFHERIVALRQQEIAIETDAANQQHYEVPAAFYRLALGTHLKYSSAYWDDEINDLDQAEARMLELSCRRAGLEDGMQVLELGCGWGSLTLWMAEHYPASRITAVSNSASQREYILNQARSRGLDNLVVLTRDVNRLELDQRFDRVVSVEMFEHVRNYQRLMARIAGWLKPEGRLFVHIFCHHKLMYPFETHGSDNWMGRHFFTGGLMPAADTLLCFQDDLKLGRRWLMSGTHYARTARAWLERLDESRDDAQALFEQQADASPAVQLQRWRMFFMACEELFAFRGGCEWLVGHFLFRPDSTTTAKQR
ncbi:MAG: cyclopropane-fatty-acyl-phospholipid synthase family protein [Wenzhouxiangellaceae bacterium]|nr:cyclopropane-fatty-acyl-phospholipid synthase family protein [Wenzhouxiangellaceae bacterium]